MTNDDIAEKVIAHDAAIQGMSDRLNRVEDNYKLLLDMAGSVKSLSLDMKYMSRAQEKLTKQVERLEHQPADDFKNLKRTILGCIISAVFGGLCSAIMAYVIHGGLAL